MSLSHWHGGERGSEVVLVHGLGSAARLEWQHTLPALASRHRVYAPDLPGFGDSDHPESGYGIELFTRALAGFIRALRLTRVTLVGASMGGGVALALAQRHPDLVERLALVDAFGLGRPRLMPQHLLLSLPGLGELSMKAAAAAVAVAPPALVLALRRRMLGAGRPLGDGDYVQELRRIYRHPGYGRAYLATIRSLAAFDWRSSDLESRLAGLRCPVLFIWGENDPLFPLEQAVEAQARLPGSRLLVIAGAGHSPHVERPQEVNRELLDFAG